MGNRRSARTHTLWAGFVAASLTLAACSAGNDDDSDGVTAADEAAEPGGNAGEPTIGAFVSGIQSITPARPVPDAVSEPTIPAPTTDTPEVTTTTPTTEASNDTTTTVADAPPSDGRLELTWAVAFPDGLSGLDPVDSLDLGTYAVLAQSLEHLTTVGTDQQLAPALALAWTPNEDATLWTFDLRPDVTFHDGSAFTADDVVYSLDRAIDLGVLSDIIEPGAVVAVDDLTVDISTTTPTLELPIRLSDAVPQTAIISESTADPDDDLIGTGPFALERFDPDDSSTFVAYDEWWGGVPTVGRLDFSFFATSRERADALAAGQVDGLAELSSVDAARMDTGGIEVVTTAANNHRQIWMRTDEGPFADVRVRQAFALSIDRQVLADELFAGFARVGNDHLIPEETPGFDTAMPAREKDDEAARALLADAGFPDGIDVTLFIGDLMEIPDLGELVVQQAASAGFRIELDVRSNSDFYFDVWCPDFGEAQCNGEQFGVIDYGHRPTPTTYLTRPLTTGGDWNSSNHSDPVYDELVGRYTSAGTDEAAAAAVGEIQAYLHDQVPVVVPYFFDLVSAHRSDLAGVENTALAQPRLATVTET